MFRDHADALVKEGRWVQVLARQDVRKGNTVRPPKSRPLIEALLRDRRRTTKWDVNLDLRELDRPCIEQTVRQIGIGCFPLTVCHGWRIPQVGLELVRSASEPEREFNQCDHAVFNEMVDFALQAMFSLSTHVNDFFGGWSVGFSLFAPVLQEVLALLQGRRRGWVEGEPIHEKEI